MPMLFFYFFSLLNLCKPLTSSTPLPFSFYPTPSLLVFTSLLRIKHRLLWHAKHNAKLKEHPRKRGARQSAEGNSCSDWRAPSCGCQPSPGESLTFSASLGCITSEYNGSNWVLPVWGEIKTFSVPTSVGSLLTLPSRESWFSFLRWRSAWEWSSDRGGRQQKQWTECLFLNSDALIRQKHKYWSQSQSQSRGDHGGQ